MLAAANGQVDALKLLITSRTDLVVTDKVSIVLAACAGLPGSVMGKRV
jgi:hypothetical protein